MKTNLITKITTRLSLTATIVALAALTMVSRADPQYTPTGNDGITASPKVRAQLADRAARPSLNSTATVMACAKCQDAFVSMADTDAKGLGARTLLAKGPATKIAAKHLCEGCATTITVTGNGKAKHDVVTHTCGAGTLACCGGK